MKSTLKQKDYLSHEALDRTALIMELVEAQLVGHPGFTKTEKSLVESIRHQLFTLYQKVGTRHIK